MNRLISAGAILLLLGSTACQTTSCGSRPRRLDFGNLEIADRLDVIGAGRERVATTMDKAKILDAVAFIERNHEGWIETWGPRGPFLDIEFYQGTEYLGTFGISIKYIVVGGMSKDVPASEIATLAKRLGLPWPSAK